jgi:Protein of unknown function (DUF1588)/Protein of unknown function (DUF1592)/Protein of unknown function (DUF1585)
MYPNASLFRLPALLVALSACQGNISGPSDGSAASAGSLAGAPTGGTGGSSPLPPSPTDDELRGKDPELFEVALRYFPGQAAAPGKARLARLTRVQLDLTARSLLPDAFAASATAQTTLPRDPLQTNYEYADNLSVSPATFTPLTTWAGGLSKWVQSNPSSVLDCNSAEDTACLDRATRAFVTRAFRGVVSEAALARYVAHVTRTAAELGLSAAASELVELALTSPWFVFRDEVRTEATGRLQPAQLLQHLSYTLADAPPEALGLGAAAAPLSGEELARAVAGVLETPAARDKLLRFFLAWLEVKEPSELDIAPSVYPELTPEVAAAMVEDTRAFLAKQLQRAAPVLGDVTESNDLLVAAPSSFLYGLSAAGPHTLNPEQRLGIFTQPAVIASHSGPTSTRLVKRGVFFTRKVMCLPLGQPPAGVDTSVPESATGSERERIESATSSGRCAGCHAFINPFGFMQESYDAIGRFREVDGASPVDPSISVDFLDEGTLTTKTSVEALRGLTRSLRFQQCFTRQLFRFYSGRDETAEDDPLLRQLFFELAQGEHDILQTLRGLASSELFGSRKEAP